MQQLFDSVSLSCSRIVTRSYSTSFTLGIQLLSRRLHDPIYAIYGFVRLADEIVDTFHGHDKVELLGQFKVATWDAIEKKISLNPILHAFQHTVHAYQIDRETIEQFLYSMEMDLNQKVHNRESFDLYILGSAEVVGLMCLKVFVHSHPDQYEVLKPYAMRLGAAFQKVNFLRDLHADYVDLGRVYFPDVSFESFSEESKCQIESEILEDFDIALQGIRMLPPGARLGVYTAYLYYRKLFAKITRTPADCILQRRIRISNPKKVLLMCAGMIRHNLGHLT